MYVCVLYLNICIWHIFPPGESKKCLSIFVTNKVGPLQIAPGVPIQEMEMPRSLRGISAPGGKPFWR